MGAKIHEKATVHSVGKWLIKMSFMTKEVVVNMRFQHCVKYAKIRYSRLLTWRKMNER